MRSYTSAVFGLLVVTLAVTVGCQRLNVKRSIHVNPGDVQDMIIDGPRSQQKINVGIASTAPIDVYIILSAEEQAVKSKLLAGQKPDESKVLDKALKVDNATLQATIPAKSEFRILLTGAKKAADVEVEAKSL
jgi:hypothetical protein